MLTADAATGFWSSNSALQDDTGGRIRIMQKDEGKLCVDACYIEKSQRDGVTANSRRRITEWLLAQEISGDTVAVAQNCMDRFLSTKSCRLEEMKLVVR